MTPTLYDPKTGKVVFHYHRLSAEERATFPKELTTDKPIETEVQRDEVDMASLDFDEETSEMTYGGPSYFYIASPYTHKDPFIMQARYYKAVDFTSWLIEQYRYHVFAPIVHSHPLCTHRQLRPEYNFWMELDKIMITQSDGLIVLEIDGWEQSVGIANEIQFAKELKKPVYTSREMWPQYNHEMPKDDYSI